MKKESSLDYRERKKTRYYVLNGIRFFNLMYINGAKDEKRKRKLEKTLRNRNEPNKKNDKTDTTQNDEISK